ncbi:hypothetical protein BJX96DRAFT_169032 [Aspergillus floccosus]
MPRDFYISHLWVWSNIIYEDLPLVPKYATAHGVTMSIAFVVIFPLGAILLRVPQSKISVSIHIACQILGVALMIAGLATGIRVGKILDRSHNNAHTVLGTILVVFLLVQPIIGFFHHRRFRATQQASPWTSVHVWLGRICVLLGIINGGMGLKLAANTHAGLIVYGVLAGVFGAAFVAVAGWKGGLKLRRKEKQPEVSQMEI